MKNFIILILAIGAIYYFFFRVDNISGNYYSAKEVITSDTVAVHFYEFSKGFVRYTVYFGDLSYNKNTKQYKTREITPVIELSGTYKITKDDVVTVIFYFPDNNEFLQRFHKGRNSLYFIDRRMELKQRILDNYAQQVNFGTNIHTNLSKNRLNEIKDMNKVYGTTFRYDKSDWRIAWNFLVNRHR